LKKIVLVLFIMVLILLITSCAMKMIRTEGDEDAAQRLFDRLTAYNSEVKSLEAKALLIYKDARRTLSFRASVASIEESTSFRLDLNDFVFNKPVVSLIRNKEATFLILYREKKYYSINNEDLDFTRLIGFELPGEILIPMLMGKVYVGDGGNILSLVDSSTLLIENADFSEEIYFNNLGLPERTLYTYSPLSYDLHYSKFETFYEVYFPKKIAVEDRDRTLNISYSSVIINQDISDETFSIDIKALEHFHRAEL